MSKMTRAVMHLNIKPRDFPGKTPKLEGALP